MNTNWHQNLWDAVDRRVGEMVEIRRHLHQHPEPSGEEIETSRYLHERLTASGIAAKLSPTGRGVVAESGDQSAGRRVALRGDIDALLLDDQKHVEYHSQVEGVMHACGHDAHTACAYGAMAALHEAAKTDLLPCPITWRGIFQPAEETATGASEMIAGGALADVDCIFSLHVDPTRPTGVVGVRRGTFTAHCDAMEIDVRGIAGHSARPHESQDAIAAAAEFVSSLYQYVPRGIDSQDAVVVSITQIHGGSNSNVLPERVRMTGMIRSLGTDVRNHAVAHVSHLADSVGVMTGTKIEVKFGAQMPGVENHAELNDLVANIAGSLLGTDRVQWMDRPSMGGEDFAFYLQHVPGVMFRLGSSPGSTPASGLHTPLFDIDEHCLSIGAKILATSVVEATLAGDILPQEH